MSVLACPATWSHHFLMELQCFVSVSWQILPDGSQVLWSHKFEVNMPSLVIVDIIRLKNCSFSLAAEIIVYIVVPHLLLGLCCKNSPQ